MHLVSEHVWCDDYLVRSLYLKNTQTGESRTVCYVSIINININITTNISFMSITIGSIILIEYTMTMTTVLR